MIKCCLYLGNYLPNIAANGGIFSGLLSDKDIRFTLGLTYKVALLVSILQLKPILSYSNKTFSAKKKPILLFRKTIILKGVCWSFGRLKKKIM